jgi:hypothetical protein
MEPKEKRRTILDDIAEEMENLAELGEFEW